MKPHRRVRESLTLALALAATACAESDLVGVREGTVRFVLSADDAAVVAPDRSTDLVGRAALGDVGEGLTTAFEGEHPDRPRRFFLSANVTFASIVARNLDGVLVDVAMELPTTVDVMVMEEGRKITLPDGELPPGTYDQLVVVMTEAEGVLHDGTTITITPPGGGWTAIIPVCPFTVDDGATTVVGLHFNLRHAFKWWQNRFHFEPRFECEAAPDGDVG